LFLGGAAAVVLPKEKHAEEAETLFERARTLSEIEVEGGSPFRLEALVYVRVAEGVAEGHYVRVWQSPHRWRDELTFPRYSQVRVDTESAMWRRRNTNHQPLPVVQFFQGLSLSMPREEWKGWRLTIAGRQEESNAVNCVKHRFSPPMMLLVSTTREWCFDSASGLLARQTWSDWDTTWEYLEYAPWNGKRYPRQINILQGGKKAVEARITKLVDAPNLEPATFAVPNDAEEWPWCEDARAPTIASPDLYRLVVHNGVRQAFTPVLVEVGADGHVQDAVVLRPLADPQREHDLFVDLKQRWRFEPAKCGKVPIPFTMVFEFPI
jgi:hypothetical protein